MRRNKLRAFYGVNELAKLAGETRKSMLGALLSNGVPIHKHGQKDVVYLSELKGMAPALWESVVERDTINDVLIEMRSRRANREGR